MQLIRVSKQRVPQLAIVLILGTTPLYQYYRKGNWMNLPRCENHVLELENLLFHWENLDRELILFVLIFSILCDSNQNNISRCLISQLTNKFYLFFMFLE